MTKKVIVTLLSMFFALVIVSGCSHQSDVIYDEEMFLKTVGYSNVTDINKSVVLVLTNEIPQPIGFRVLDLISKSDYEIYMSKDYNVRILYFDQPKNQWKEIENKVVYSDQEIILDHSFNDLPRPVVVDPGKSVDNSINKLRIIVSGNIIKNGKKTEQIVIAYTDVSYPFN